MTNVVNDYGNYDIVSVFNLDSPNYIVRIYDSETGGLKLVEQNGVDSTYYDSEDVSHGSGADIIVEGLNSAGGTVWVTLQANGKAESARTAVSYQAES